MMRLHGRARKSGNETTISAIGLILIAVAGFASEVLASPLRKSYRCHPRPAWRR